MRNIIIASLLVFSHIATGFELELSRTFNKVLVENNQLLVTMDSSGSVEILYPEFYKNTDQLNFKADIKKINLIDDLVKQIDQEFSSVGLKNKLQVIKRNNNLPLYYSSEVDSVELKIAFDSSKTWQISIDNLAELKHHYQYMGRWQPLIDLIAEVESWSRKTQVKINGGEAQ